jgi:hypothetical protein
LLAEKVGAGATLFYPGVGDRHRAMLQARGLAGRAGAAARR